jgi:Skp family chaperone for outer membrane proteins
MKNRFLVLLYLKGFNKEVFVFRKSILLFVGFLSCTCVNALTIATINMNEILQSQQVQKRLNSEFDEAFSAEEKQLRKEALEFQTKVEDFHKNQSLLSQEAMGKQRSVLSQKQHDFSQRQQKLQLEAARFQQDQQHTLLKQIKKIATGIAKRDGYDFVAAQQAFFYIKYSNDITDQVLQEINK